MLISFSEWTFSPSGAGEQQTCAPKQLAWWQHTLSFRHRPCKAIAPQFEGWAAQYQDVVFVKVDVDQSDELAGKYEISAMPTFKVGGLEQRCELRPSTAGGLFRSF